MLVMRRKAGPASVELRQAFVALRWNHPGTSSFSRPGKARGGVVVRAARDSWRSALVETVLAHELRYLDYRLVLLPGVVHAGRSSQRGSPHPHLGDLVGVDPLPARRQIEDLRQRLLLGPHHDVDRVAVEDLL